MPVISKRNGYDVIYEFHGVVGRLETHQYFDLTYYDYHEIGDALGIIVDMRFIKRISLSAPRIIQTRTKGVIFNRPVAFLGAKDNFFITFMGTIEALTNQGLKRYSFCESVGEAKIWIGEWYKQQGKERQKLLGYITSNPTPPIHN